MSEPVEYQYRTRPDWIAEWNGWSTCSKESAEAYEKNPYLHDWHYEVRALYTSPPAQRKPLTDEQVNLFINGRGDEGDDDYVEPTGDGFGLTDADLVRLVRRVEVAHGIKENT